MKWELGPMTGHMRQNQTQPQEFEKWSEFGEESWWEGLNQIEKWGEKRKEVASAEIQEKVKWAFRELQTLYLFYCISYNMHVYKKKIGFHLYIPETFTSF